MQVLLQLVPIQKKIKIHGIMSLALPVKQMKSQVLPPAKLTQLKLYSQTVLVIAQKQQLMVMQNPLLLPLLLVKELPTLLK